MEELEYGGWRAGFRQCCEECEMRRYSMKTIPIRFGWFDWLSCQLGYLFLFVLFVLMLPFVLVYWLVAGPNLLVDGGVRYCRTWNRRGGS